MIGPGSLPRFPGRRLKKTALTYKRRRSRRRKHQAPTGRTVNTDIVAFDHGPMEFPVASVRPREARGRAVAALADLQRWLAARWSWFKPRTVPCAVAALGMIAVMAAGDYLAHHLDQQDAHKTTIVRIELGPR